MNEYLPQAPDILTLSEAAQTLRIAPSELQKLMESGEVRHFEIAGKPLILKAVLVDFLEKSCQVCYNNLVKASAPG